MIIGLLLSNLLVNFFQLILILFILWVMCDHET